VHRPWWRRLLFRAVWLVGWVPFALACRVKIEGDVPKGPAILVSNHPNYIDGPLAFLLSPRVRVIAKPNPYRSVQWAMYLYDAYITWRGAAAHARRHLRAGGIVWIVPEGRRWPGPLGRPRRGAAQIAQETGAPIVPTALLGTADLRLREWRPWRRPRVTIVLGKPRYVFDGESIREVSDEFMEELSKMTGVPYEPSWPSGGS
jgi:1-acyl-sn-glycerol-3-phosphate acyltransferase